MTVLFVAAVSEEAAHLPEGADLLVTGIGTLPAAITLTEELCARREAGTLPERIINVGTCGALREEIPNGVYEIDRVHKHDFNVEFTSGIGGDALPRVITPEVTGLFPTGQLATGDTFVEDTATRDRIAQVAGLVDMEGYALAAVAHRFGVPIHNEAGDYPWVTTRTGRDTVRIQTRTVTEGKVPNVVGMGLSDGLYLLEKAGLEVQVSGVGTIVKQSIPAGTVSNGNRIIKIQLS